MEAILQKDKIPPTLAQYVMNLYTGTQGENNLYYHDSTLENGAGDYSYRYAGGDYTLTQKAIDEGYTQPYLSYAYLDVNKKNVLEFYDNGNRYPVGYEVMSWVGEMYSENEKLYFKLNYETNSKEYTNAYEVYNKAVNDGYFSEPVKNFVCFGSDEEMCPVNNLYRIIGVFNNKIKLIKYDFAGENLLGTDGNYGLTAKTFVIGSKVDIIPNAVGYSYGDQDDSKTSYKWEESKLNTVNLNTNYLKNIGEKWANYISTSIWKTNNNYSLSDFINLPLFYMFKIENLSETYKTKVGLFYASDFGYAASPLYWTYSGFKSDKSDYRQSSALNWMYMGLEDLGITVFLKKDIYSVRVSGSGFIGGISPDENRLFVRPSFYLKEDVLFSSGNGSINNPYRISE